MPGFSRTGRPVWASLLLLSLIFGSSMRAVADGSLRLYYLSLPGLLEADGKTGPFAETLTEISRRAGVRFDMRHMVMNRMIRALQQEDIPAAGVPQLGPMIAQRFKKQLRRSPPVIFRCDYIFVRAGAAIPHSLKDMAGHILVVSPMTTLPPPLQNRTDITVLETPSDASALTALSMGRADLWVNDETTTMAAIRDAGVDNIIYDTESPFYTWPAHMVYSNAVPDDIVDRINETILSMARDGTLKRQLPQNFADRYDTYLARGQDGAALSQQ